MSKQVQQIINFVRAEYCVIEKGKVVFASNDPGEIAAFIQGRGDGQICAVLKTASSVAA